MQSIFTFTLHLFTGKLPAAAAVDIYKDLIDGGLHNISHMVEYQPVATTRVTGYCKASV